MQSPTITISDENVLYVADRGDYTAIELNRSAPEEGVIVKHSIPADQAGDLIDQRTLEQRKFDEQDGIHYRYKKSLFDYAVVRDNVGGERLLFQMPRSEYVLNMVAEIGFALLMLCIAVFVLTNYRYASKHPETIVKTPSPWQKPEN